MKLPMSDELGKVIQFVAPTSSTPMVAIEPPDYSQRRCDHSNFLVHQENRTVKCGKCQREMDAMHVLILIASSETRRRWFKTAAEEHDRKESAKTIKAAVINLGKRGITPEKFLELYQKYEAEFSGSGREGAGVPGREQEGDAK